MHLTALWFVSVRFCWEIQGLNALTLPSAMHSFVPDLFTPRCGHTSLVQQLLGGEWAQNRGASVTLQLGLAKCEAAVKENTHLLLFSLCVH